MHDRPLLDAEDQVPWPPHALDNPALTRRLAAVDLVVLGHLTLEQVAAKLNVSPSSVGNWVRAYHSGGYAAVAPPERAPERGRPRVHDPVQVRRRYGAERAAIRVEAVKMVRQFGISKAETCRQLKLNRQSLENWLHRFDQGGVEALQDRASTGAGA